RSPIHGSRRRYVDSRRRSPRALALLSWKRMQGPVTLKHLGDQKVRTPWLASGSEQGSPSGLVWLRLTSPSLKLPKQTKSRFTTEVERSPDPRSSREPNRANPGAARQDSWKD